MSVSSWKRSLARGAVPPSTQISPSDLGRARLRRAGELGSPDPDPLNNWRLHGKIMSRIKIGSRRKCGERAAISLARLASDAKR
jgi:hypothetical protein